MFKNFIRFSILSIVLIETYTAGNAQVSVGIENSRLVFGEYTFKDHFSAKVNVSVYSEKLGFQYARATLGYHNSLEKIAFSGQLHFGSAFNRSYYNTGLGLNVNTILAKRLILDGTINPWYDSGYGYKTCFQAIAGCKITNEINIKAGYTTIPEYRMSEKRIIAGLDFHVKKLCVYPRLSIGTKSYDGGKNVRVLVDFAYMFNVP